MVDSDDLIQVRKHGWSKFDWMMSQDDKGKPVGKYKTPLQPIREEVETIKQFLIAIQKNRREENAMGKDEKKPTTGERVNMVFLAGVLKFDPKSEEKSARCLIDVGLKSSIAAGCFKDQAGLADKLLRFREGDFIRIVAMLDPYGVKQADNTWKNGLSIRITEIKNDPPVRAASKMKADDDIPF